MIASDTLTYIISIAREIREAAPAMINVELDENMDSDHYTQDALINQLDDFIPEDHVKNSLYQEFKTAVNQLNEEDRYDLVALTWVGRGSFSSGEWESALLQAKEASNNHTVEYLMNIPLLPDYLEEARIALC